MPADFSIRIVREIESLCYNPPVGYLAEQSKDPFSDDVNLTMTGPKGTPYEEGQFRLQLKFPTNYPFAAPILQFITPIYHPNIDHRGNICISPLHDLWTPAFLVKQILEFVRSMLANPQADYFVNVDCAFDFKFHKDIYEKTAKDWTRRFAGPGNSENLEKFMERLSLLEKEEAQYKGRD